MQSKAVLKGGKANDEGKPEPVPPAKAALRTIGDWKEVEDPKTGKIYYFNKKENKTCWKSAGTSFEGLEAGSTTAAK